MRGVLVAVAVLLLPPVATAAGGSFERVPAHLAAERAFDIGVIDREATAEPAPFTLNHKYRSSLLIGGRDATAALGLSPSYGFPGLEYLQAPAPPPAAPGLYLYISDRPHAAENAVVHLRSVGTPAAGRLVFAVRETDLEIKETEVATVSRGSVGGRLTVDFSIQPGGRVDISTQHVDLPILARGMPAPTFVGAAAVAADRPDFELTLRDRHSYATGDFNDDGREDLFILSGGLGDGIADPAYRDLIEDEVMALGPDGTYENIGGLTKGTCRGRGSAAPDADGDGLVDLFVGCEGESPILYLHGQGWQRTALPLRGEQYRWANVDGRPDPELLVFRDRRMVVYSRGTHRDYSVPLRGAPSGTAAVGDLFGTGRPVLLVPSRQGSTLIRGRRARSPRRWGLPDRATAAAFVDVDNDGRREVHLADAGLYSRHDRHGRSFRPVPGTKRLLHVGGAHPILNWADLDGDGRRDLLAGICDRYFPRRIRARELLNHHRADQRAGHWLEIDTTDALTGTVTVRAGGRRYTGWVGESEGSRWSDAHRRVYFGVGRARHAEVTLRTEQGRVTRRTATNRIVSLG